MYKQYLTEGTQYQDLWAYQANTQGALYGTEESIDQDVKWLEQENELVGYPTQKPEGIIRRILTSCTSPGDIVFDCFMGSGTTQTVAMKMGRRFIGADINLGAIQTTTNRLIDCAKKIKAKPAELDLIDKDANVFYTSFEVFNVNNYDIFRNQLEAKQLLIEALEIEPLDGSNLYDGEKDGRMVKIMPMDRIATRVDLNELITGFDRKVFEKRRDENANQPVESILIVCMGHEPDLSAFLRKEIEYIIDVEIVDILRDKSKLEFKREAEAEVIKENGSLVIKSFYPMNLLQKLSLLPEDVSEWKELVDSIMIDWNYDGNVLKPDIVDVPERNAFVEGSYIIPEYADKIRIKITDLLSESKDLDI